MLDPIKKSELEAGTAEASLDEPLSDFQLVDNEDGSYTVCGIDSSDNLVDLSKVASLSPAPASSDLTILTVDPPKGMTFMVHALGKITPANEPVEIEITVAWGEGPVGPFRFYLPMEVVALDGGVELVPGTPTPD